MLENLETAEGKASHHRGVPIMRRAFALARPQETAAPLPASEGGCISVADFAAGICNMGVMVVKKDALALARYLDLVVEGKVSGAFHYGGPRGGRSVGGTAPPLVKLQAFEVQCTAHALRIAAQQNVGLRVKSEARQMEICRDGIKSPNPRPVPHRR